MLYFITGNKEKFAEVKTMLNNVEQVDRELPEIQHLDAQEVVKAKLLEALQHKPEECIVEDTSLSLDGLNGLPGPLIKWFIKSMGSTGLAELAEKMGNTKATARTVVGYARNLEDIHYFEGVIQGNVVHPSTESQNGFGWDVCFQPEGYNITFSQMPREEKNKISMRSVAFGKLKDYLEQQ